MSERRSEEQARVHDLAMPADDETTTLENLEVIDFIVADDEDLIRPEGAVAWWGPKSFNSANRAINVTAYFAPELIVDVDSVISVYAANGGAVNSSGWKAHGRYRPGQTVGRTWRSQPISPRGVQVVAWFRGGGVYTTPTWRI